MFTRPAITFSVIAAALGLACAGARAEPDQGAGVGGPAWPLRTDDGAAHPAAQGAMPVVRAVQAEQIGDMTRLMFVVSEPLRAKAYVLADPARVIIDLPETEFRIPPEAGRGPAAPLRPAPARGRPGSQGVSPAAPLAGVISSFRFGLFATGRSRIVIDLTEPARIVRVASQPGSDERPGYLVVELAKTSREAFAAAAAESVRLALAAPPPSTTATPAPDAGSRPVVVIDAGHGGVDTGALGGPGVVEKQITADFASALAARLEAGGHYRVILTRSSDVFVPLGERVRIARSNSADLFISIHADTLADAAGVSGATVYTVSDRASDAEAARLADKENQADAAAGLDRLDDKGEVTDILFDLTRRETRAYSHVFARSLIGYWKAQAALNKNPQRSAGFMVLKAPDVPSVLLELGYLSSSRDAAALTSAEWRDRMTIAVARAVDQYFAARGPSAGHGPEGAALLQPRAPAGPAP